MMLALDIGNTSIQFGIFDNDKLLCTERTLTKKNKGVEHYENIVQSFIQKNKISSNEIDDVIISSVVPEIDVAMDMIAYKITKKHALILNKNIESDLKSDFIPVTMLGADLVCDCIAAREKYKTPAIIVDMGTATKLLALDSEGKFIGAIIAPGAKISLEALAEKTSLLPNIPIKKPENVLGTNTEECMQSGIAHGNACMIDGLIDRINDENNFINPSVVATGGYMQNIYPLCKTKMNFDEHLILKGLYHIYLKLTQK